MAEAVISNVADRFGVYLLQDASLLNGIRDEVEWLERELRSMLCFLKDALSKEKQNDEMVRRWVKNVIDVATDAEDVIEAFMLDSDILVPVGSFQRLFTRCSPSSAFENFMLTIGRCLPIFSLIVHHHRIGRDVIETVKARLVDIAQQREELCIVDLENDGILQGKRQLPAEYVDPVIVGFADHKDNIVQKLLSEEKNQLIISLIGVSGSGKTTLVRNIFHTIRVSKEFNACYWVSVSPDDRLPEVMKKLVEAVEGRERTDRLEYKYIIGDLNRVLSRKKYFIIMDGIRKEEWEQIQKVLPDNNNGSRVLLTTCNVDFVQPTSPSIFPYELPPLNEERSIRLLLRKAYPNENVEEFPEDLKLVGQALVGKCQGLPLALVVLGSFLSVEEKNRHHWAAVSNILNCVSSEVGSYLDVLYFCYEALPHNLKQCFLYLGSFPKLSEIVAKPLIRLWMVEGFLPPNLDDTWEETANAFMEDLVARSLVQVLSKGRDGKIKNFHIHDQIHDLCKEEARKYRFLNFQCFYATTNRPIPLDIEATRRLAICTIKPTDYQFSTKKKKNKTEDEHNHSRMSWRTTNLRTLHFGFSGVLGPLSLNGLKLLRILDVKLDYTWEEVPKEIGSLLNLRYLRWKSGPFLNYQLIKGLHNLQIIDVTPGLGSVDATIGDFKNLQFLRTIFAGSSTVTGLARLTKLRKAVISNILDSDWKGLLRSLKRLHGLVCLKLISFSPVPNQVLSMFSRHHMLRHLAVSGALAKLPKSTSFPPKLTKLTLSLSFLEQDPMSTLMELPNLIYLKLMDSAFCGKNIHCRSGGFTQLRHLVLKYMTSIDTWRVDDGALPVLTHLTINTCDYLKKLPKGLKCVITLQELTLLGMPSTFMKRVRPMGKDWDKIKHVRYIYSSTPSESVNMHDFRTSCLSASLD